MSVIFLLVGAAALVSRVPHGGVTYRGLLLCAILPGAIIAGGYVLSVLGYLNQPFAWTVFAAGFMCCCLAWSMTRRHAPEPGIRTREGLIRAWKGLLDELRVLPVIWRTVLVIVVGTVAVLGVLNFLYCMLFPPGNFDSMVYHLPRVAHFLQNNSLRNYDAGNWAQITHPKYSAVLLLFTWIVSGGYENAFQLVPHTAYWVGLFAMYGIARESGAARWSALLAACVFGLLTVVLMHTSCTAENDLPIAACVGISLYFLLIGRRGKPVVHLALSAMVFSVALGMKVTAALGIPAMLTMVWFAIPADRFVAFRQRARTGAGRIVLWCALVVAGVLPSGYVEDFRDLGNPIGSPGVIRWHVGSINAESLEGGAVNILRYAIDFLSLDRFPHTPMVLAAQKAIKFLPAQLYSMTGYGYDGNARYIRSPFRVDKPPVAHEDASMWGILGFGLVWISVLVALGRGNRPDGLAALAVASLVFFLCQSFGGPYHHCRGRYFMSGAFFAVPPVILFFHSRFRFVTGYAASVLVLGCCSAFCSVMFRPLRPMLETVAAANGSRGVSVFPARSQDRLARFALPQPWPRVFANFDRLVPPHAIVAVAIADESIEYPLFGEGLTRTLLIVRTFDGRSLPIPPRAQFLLFDTRIISPSQGDIFLGETWYLRRLK
jgi:hypothetical protein